MGAVTIISREMKNILDRIILNLKNVFYYSLIGLACNYMFLQDLSLLINRKK